METAKPFLFLDVITIFPGMFESVLGESIIKRAQENNLARITVHNLRDFTKDRHATVDDYPYGGIPGMLMKCDPLARSLRHILDLRQERAPRVIFLSPQGSLLTHARAESLSHEQSLVLLCGRYKGVDQRIVDEFVHEEISVGDYVVSGGELPAMILMDAVIRLLPEALGDADSAASDSLFDGLLEAPNYTRPEDFEGKKVPPVLLSGHHENVRKWRHEQSIFKTRFRRPDLFAQWEKRKRAETEEPNL